MKKLIFFIPIIGFTIFAARGFRYQDLEYTVPNVLILGAANGVTLGCVLSLFNF